MAAMSLPPGFRFHPTDDELVAYYLHRKINGLTIELEIIPEVDLYKCEPWDLPDKSYIPSKDMEWYFYSPRDRKYPNGSRTNRATKAGYWKATGKDRLVHSHKRPVGMKKTLVYYRGRAPHGIRSNWVMHEYRLLEKVSSSSSSTSLKDSYALCRVFKKTIIVPKSKEEAQIRNVENESSWICGEQINAGESEASQGREAKDENFNVQCYSMFPSDTSSDLTQGTCTPAETCIAEDHMQPPFITSDEANSSANLYSLGVDCSSSLIQDIESFTSLLHQQFAYPPLDMEDFPQINIAETGKGSKSEIMEDLVMYHHDTNGALEEIFSLCSSQENNSNAL